MKATAYFFDDNGVRGTILAGIIWPICVIPFYLLYKNIYMAILAGFTLASFISLFHFNTLIESIVFFMGIGLLLFTSMIMMNPKKCNILNTIIGILVCILVGIIGYFFNKNIMKPIKDKPGNLSYIYNNIGSYIFMVPFVAAYIYLFYKLCLKHKS